MPLVHPAVSIAQVIADANVAVLGDDLFVGLVKPVSKVVPAKAVFVRGTEGLPADRFFNQMDEVRYPTVQIRIRSSEYEAGYKLAKDIYRACQSSRPLGIKDVVARQSEPVYLAQDENKNHQWSLNFDLFYQD